MDVVWTLIAAFGGGLIGAILSAVVLWRIRNTERRDKAAEALWDYQYALSGYSNREIGWVVEGVVFLASADFAQVRDALRRAYPYAGYLDEASRKRLFRWAQFDIPVFPDGSVESELQAGESAGRLATELEEKLDRIFPHTKALRKTRKGAGDE